MGLYGAGLYNVGQLAATTTVLVSGTNPSTYGTSIRLTATVTSSSATGSVTFKDGSVTIGTATLGHGSGFLVISTLGGGSRSLTAVYGGNNNYATSTSNTVTQTVNTASTTTTISSSANPATEGDNLTFTATVSPSTATGTVTFKDAGSPIGTASLGHGSGSLTIAARQGTHFITATYAGNGNYSTSTSTIITQTIQAGSSGNSGTSGSGGGGGGGGGRRVIALPSVSITVPTPSIAPATTGRVLSAAQSSRLRMLKRRAAALQKTIDHTSNVRTKTALQGMMRIVERAIARVLK